MTDVHVLAAPDKFRGTATAGDAGRAMAAAAARCGWTVSVVPMADGGEGTLAAFGGANRTATVTGPLGRPVGAPWRYDSGTAVIESAAACGLHLTGGAVGNDPEAATTRGVGELIAAALRAGARRIVVGIGGSASTDGGLGAVEALAAAGLLAAVRQVEIVVACDVQTRFSDAARVFGPQKGADAAAVSRLTDRLVAARRRYVTEFGLDPEELIGSGGAGGLAGGLAALGASLAPGGDLVANEVGLDAAIARADVVITGEGRLDATSLAGKVVGTVWERAGGRKVIVVVGDADPGVRLATEVVSLTERFGRDRAMNDTLTAIEDAVVEALARLRAG